MHSSLSSTELSHTAEGGGHVVAYYPAQQILLDTYLCLMLEDGHQRKLTSEEKTDAINCIVDTVHPCIDSGPGSEASTQCKDVEVTVQVEAKNVLVVTTKLSFSPPDVFPTKILKSFLRKRSSTLKFEEICRGTYRARVDMSEALEVLPEPFKRGIGKVLTVEDILGNDPTN